MLDRLDKKMFSFALLIILWNITHELYENKYLYKCLRSFFCHITHHKLCFFCLYSKYKRNLNYCTIFCYINNILIHYLVYLVMKINDKSSLVILSSWSIYLTIGCCFSKTSASGEVLRFFLCSNSHMQLGQTGNNKLIFQHFKCTFTDHTFSNLNQKLPRRCQN